jgi:hypothetical protein
MRTAAARLLNSQCMLSTIHEYAHGIRITRQPLDGYKTVKYIQILKFKS